jgi:hypothetical protein
MSEPRYSIANQALLLYLRIHFYTIQAKMYHCGGIPEDMPEIEK